MTPLILPWFAQLDQPTLDKCVRYCNLYPSNPFNSTFTACKGNDSPILPIIVSPETLVYVFHPFFLSYVLTVKL